MGVKEKPDIIDIIERKRLIDRDMWKTYSDRN
jgi:hypothetical protein